MDFIDVLQIRRSCRKFDSRPVEEEKIREILEAARIAPSWENKQGWKFIVVKERKTIEELTKACILINFWMKKAPVIIVTCGDPGRSGYKNEQFYYMVDVAVATEHLVLAATNLSLGTCWVGGFNEEKVRNVLDIPGEIKVVAMIALGYPAGKKGAYEKVVHVVTKGSRRKPLEEITNRERWSG